VESRIDESDSESAWDSKGSAEIELMDTSFAETYADQNEQDYQALQEAVASGRVTAEQGV
jgi:hypothetical protein